MSNETGDLIDATAYINAGGRGTRLNPLLPPDGELGIAKALLTVGHPPVKLVDHHVNRSLSAGFPSVAVGAGDQKPVAECVADTYGDSPDIKTFTSSTRLGTGGDLVRAVLADSGFFGSQIVVSNVDTILDTSERDALDFHRQKGADLTVVLTTNDGVPNENAYYVDTDDRILHCQESSGAPENEASLLQLAYRASSTGALVINKDVIEEIDWRQDDGPLCLYKDVIGLVLREGLAYAFNNGDRFFRDIGTVATWQAAQMQPNDIERHLHRNKLQRT